MNEISVLLRATARVSDVYLTPRAVSRCIPSLTRHELSRRRAVGLPPRFEIVAGCVMYSQRDIERLTVEMEGSVDGK